MNRRKRVTATIKMTFTDDRDLIAWWQSIPLGSRNAVMKDILREHMAREGGHYRPRPIAVDGANMPVFDLSQLAQVRDDTAWIRDALHDIPAYLEQVLQSVAAMQVTPAGNGGSTGPNLSAQDRSRREANMRKHHW